MSRAIFNFKPFSLKQRKVLAWWRKGSPYADYNGIICQGSVRSGKTIAQALSYCQWAMATFENQQFAFCSQTVGAFKRNVWSWLKIVLLSRGYKIEERRTDNLIILKRNGKTNYFYYFGGRDERSQDLIQGFTLAGAYFDEVALMPESFVNQATARCSVEFSKLWFNCNPEHPEHWFKVNWIDNADNKKYYNIHFLLEDNLSLAQSIRERLKSTYFGVFYKRAVLGLWVIAEGAIYDMFSDDNLYEGEFRNPDLHYSRYISVDYGTTNPMVFLEVFDDGKNIYVEREYCYDSKETYRQKTDEQYADDLDAFCGNEKPIYVIVDPSAASFKVVLKNRGYRVKDAENDVENGIRTVSTLLGRRLLHFHKRCTKTRSEHSGYVWTKDKLNGKETPLKVRDHTCITGDTLIDTPSGQVPIENLVNKQGKVYCFDGVKKVISDFYNVICTRKNADVYKIELEDGRIIKATDNHEVLTQRGYVQVKDLTLDDSMVNL